MTSRHAPGRIGLDPLVGAVHDERPFRGGCVDAAPICEPVRWAPVCQHIDRVVVGKCVTEIAATRGGCAAEDCEVADVGLHVWLVVPVGRRRHEVSVRVILQGIPPVVLVRKDVFTIAQVHGDSQHNLLDAAQALGLNGLLLRLLQGRQQHGRKDRDDGDHHQEFDEGKTACLHGFLLLRTTGLAILSVASYPIHSITWSGTKASPSFPGSPAKPPICPIQAVMAETRGLR